MDVDSEQIQMWALQVSQGAVMIILFWLGAVVLRTLLARFLRRLNVDRAVVGLMAETVFFTMLVVGIITGLGTMSINVSALVASLGLGGFALGFALRDAISSVLAGILVLIYRPFRVGQRISVAGFEGTVEEINLRYTVLDNREARQLVPNQLLFTNAVKVYRS
jgi:small-conductance mechanosensitive channel